jgi:hypothetical protein
MIRCAFDAICSRPPTEQRRRSSPSDRCARKGYLFLRHIVDDRGRCHDLVAFRIQKNLLGTLTIPKPKFILKHLLVMHVKYSACGRSLAKDLHSAKVKPACSVLAVDAPWRRMAVASLDSRCAFCNSVCMIGTYSQANSLLRKFLPISTEDGALTGAACERNAVLLKDASRKWRPVFGIACIPLSWDSSPAPAVEAQRCMTLGSRARKILEHSCLLIARKGPEFGNHAHTITIEVRIATRGFRNWPQR